MKQYKKYTLIKSLIELCLTIFIGYIYNSIQHSGMSHLKGSVSIFNSFIKCKLQLRNWRKVHVKDDVILNLVYVINLPSTAPRSRPWEF